MTDAYLPTERHLQVVPSLPNPLPWWCRTFGHTFIRQPTITVGNRLLTGHMPLTVMCRRCGTRP